MVGWLDENMHGRCVASSYIFFLKKVASSYIIAELGHIKEIL